MKKRVYIETNVMQKNRLGSNFDDFLKSQRLLDVTEATAIKRVIAHEIARGMKRRKLTKTEMANRMKTSRASLERLLDPANSSVTLTTLSKFISA
jgi:DNA-binding Xre family transcriptional regulator